MEMETKKVDSQGRISLPPEWRRENLGENREVIIQREENNLVIKPKPQPDLTAFFDSITVNIPPEAFKDPHSLRKALIEATE
jgi:bifunctional DNA-binding transcriptional regulator/antitoxin component of YhaV-PrlF toxin-antitoxin module